MTDQQVMDLTPTKTGPVSPAQAKLAMMAKYLAARTPTPPSSRPQIGRRATGGGPLPLSFAQRQVWLHSQISQGSTAYNEPFTIHRRGPLDVAVLERTLNEIIRRHEAWRTTFPMVDGQPVQTVHDDVRITFPVNDLRLIPSGDRDVEALRMASDDARQPFDLAKGPLLKARLVRVGDAEYRLYLTLHQLIFDGVSVYRIFLEELATLYLAFAAGKPSSLPEVPIRYGDFALWQQQSLQEDTFREQVAYWRGVLGAEPAVLELATDRPRPAFQSFRGALYTFLFPRVLADALKKLSQGSCATLFMGLLATFYGLMYRYTGQRDIFVGTVTAGRKLPELERIIGLFINPLVLRGHVSDTTTFRDLLLQAREVSASALSNGDVPFEHLIREFHPRRDPSRNPFFQSMLSLQPPLPSVPGWDLTVFDVDSGGSKLDLHFLVDDRPEGILGRLIYNPDLFDASTVASLVMHWQNLLESVVQSPDLAVCKLRLLSAGEHNRLLIEWNATEAVYPEEETIHRLFEAQAVRTPGHVAVRDRGQTVTYCELDRRANQIARLLREFGVASEDPVGVCLERSAEMVVSLLGILKAGCSYVPLDPSYPEDRLAFMVDDAGIRLVITKDNLRQLLPRDRAEVVCLDGDQEKITHLSSLPVKDISRADNAAYMMYTSGSSGRPKGVIGLHRGAVNRFAWMWRKYPFQPDEVCCQKTSLNFVDSVWELFGPLLQGIPTVIVADEAVADPERFIQQLADHQVSRIVVVPSLLRVLLEAYSREKASLWKPRMWISSGETLTPDLARCFGHVMSDCVLLNLYGSTEVSADVTCHEVDHSNAAAPSVPIGRPISNTQVYLLDRELQLVPRGAVGEITVGGHGLARGYLHRSELTAAKFIPDSFRAKPGSNLYRTGDLGRWLPDGSLAYLGRADSLVKFRGFRIELGEIEVTLSQHAAIASAVVQLLGEDDSNKRLVAYVVRNKQGVTATDLRCFLRQRLPEYMVPAQLFFLPSLPLLPNGKVNRHELSNVENLDIYQEGITVLPRDAIESQLVSIWKSLLGRNSIGVQDNFFEVGGHSLLLSRLLQAIEDSFGRRLTFTAVFEAPTVSQLAEALRRDPLASQFEGIMPIQPRGNRTPLFWVRGGPLFLPLTRRLEASRPEFGVYLPNSKVRALPSHYRFQDLAAGLVEVVRQVRPKGPYYLGGLCVNGVLAYEMAQQLMAQGEEVPLVILYDSQNPTAYSDFSTEGRSGIFLHKLRFHLGIIARMRLGEIRPYVKERFLELKRTCNQKKSRMYYRLGWRIPERQLGNLDPLIHPAAYAYRPQPYSGRVVFFQSSEWPTGPYWDFKAGWHGLVPALEVHGVHGGHESMFDDANVDGIARTLVSCIQQVENTPRG